MKLPLRCGRFFALFTFCSYGVVFSQAQTLSKSSALETGLGKDFASETAAVNGTTLHYVRGGKGPPIILIHGFPQDWFEYHAIMPRLAKRYQVRSRTANSFQVVQPDQPAVALIAPRRNVSAGHRRAHRASGFFHVAAIVETA